MQACQFNRVNKYFSGKRQALKFGLNAHSLLGRFQQQDLFFVFPIKIFADNDTNWAPFESLDKTTLLFLILPTKRKKIVDEKLSKIAQTSKNDGFLDPI